MCFIQKRSHYYAATFKENLQSNEGDKLVIHLNVTLCHIRVVANMIRVWSSFIRYTQDGDSVDAYYMEGNNATFQKEECQG